ncbi:MAG: hypothetical protein HY013_07520 [Candidatus Solibacter usitatus]|nr:hypothetical protein [Candidatus Solibacter usitatus]
MAHQLLIHRGDLLLILLMILCACQILLMSWRVRKKAVARNRRSLGREPNWKGVLTSGRQEPLAP